jgi:hypothetical protein
MARTRLSTTIVTAGAIGNASHYKENGVLKDTVSTLNVVDSDEINFSLTEDNINIEADLTATISQLSFTKIIDKPTTIDGYGITDVASSEALTLHASDSTKHLTPAQNSFLDAVTVTAANVNHLSGIASNVQTQIDTKEASGNKGVANGYASLDSNVKIPLVQIPDSVLGQLEYQGVRSMATALPTADASNKGWFYVTSVAGNSYEVGDWAVSNGTSWDKVDNTDAVSTVAGRTGNITLTKTDVGLANVENTALSTWAGSSSITTLGTVTSGTFSGTLGAISGANLTGLNASSISSGTLPNARLDSSVVVKSTVNGVSNVISDGAGDVRSIPVNAQGSSYTLVASDNGKTVVASSTVTVPANVFAAGNTIIVYNDTGSTITISCSSVTSYITGNNTTKTSVTLAARGMCSVLFYASNSVAISGDVS